MIANSAAVSYDMTMRIAVIGSGISGLSAAYLLAPHASVTLFEQSTELGGHAHTEDVAFGSTTVSVDTGFMVYNPHRYPYFIALLKELNVASVDTVMSFSVSIPGAVEYSSNYQGLFGNPRQLMQPAYWRLLFEIVRFNRLAKKYLKTTGPQDTTMLSDFVKHYGFSRELVEWYRFPMLGSIWSAASEDVSSYPARETFRFLDNHMLLNIFNKPVWRTVRGGSREYVRALERAFTREHVEVRYASPVQRIVRSDSSVAVHTQSGSDTFDKVILATHANESLNILSDASTEEQKILGAFSYSDNEVVLHSDTSFMPRSKKAWASWNFHGGPKQSRVISLTYDMNSLQNIPQHCPVFVTLNPQKRPDEKLVHKRFTYSHPIFNARAHVAQMHMHTIQGKRNTYHAGAHLGFGFHEDGIQSAARVIEALGLPVRLTL